MTTDFDATVSYPKQVAIIHPDLGIGGAERLIVDVAVGLKYLKEHKLVIYTSHCDKSHAFEEVANGKLEVIVYGDFLPRSIFGRATILCATIRQLYLVFKLLILTRSAYDFYVIDSLAACLPFIWLYNIFFCLKEHFLKVIFYCHFPDLKLAQAGSTLKKAYRAPFDWYEEFCYGFADKLYVNSEFTKLVFLETFPSFAKKKSKQPSVVYPCIDETVTIDEKIDEQVLRLIGNQFLLSVNRFERKKNIQLAIEALHELSKTKDVSSLKLLIAGGYDSAVLENIEYHKELVSITEKYGFSHETFYDYKDLLKQEHLQKQVYFLPNISSGLRNVLMKQTLLLLYTPTREHFGIVPIEAMKYNTLVLADNTGGPRETVVPLDDDYSGSEAVITNLNGTGFLKPAVPEKWAQAILCILEMSPSQREAVSHAGEKIVSQKFTRKVMTEEINKDIVRLSKNIYALSFQETQRVTYFVLVSVLGPIVAGLLWVYFR